VRRHSSVGSGKLTIAAGGSTGEVMSTRIPLSAFVMQMAPLLLAMGLGFTAHLCAAPTGLDVYARSGVQGTPITGYVASFATTESNPSIGNLTATINWGDSSASPGTIETSGFSGLYTVSGTHTYVSAGNYAMSVDVFDITDAGDAIGSSTVAIQNAPLILTGTYFATTVNVAFNGLVATFVDENPYATVGDLTATIDWGDGSPLAAASAISRIGSSDAYDVSGTHTYTVPGLETVTISVTDANNFNNAIGTSYTGDRIFASGFD
jgi:hypothetical protein